MAYAKTWSFSINQVSRPNTLTLSEQCRYQYWAFVAMLTGLAGGLVGSGLWTMYYSCDGTTAGTAGDAVNRVGGATYDQTKWVSATAGVAHTWVVLKSPVASINGKTVYLMMDYASGAEYYMYLYCGTSAPTGGNTTTAPTFTDKREFGDTNQWWNASYAAGSPGMYTHMCLTSDGGFIFFTTSGQNLGILNAVCLLPVQQPHASDNYPFWRMQHYNASGMAFDNLYMAFTFQRSLTSDGGLAYDSLPLLGNAAGPSGAIPDALTGKMMLLPPYVYTVQTGGNNRWHARGYLPDCFGIPIAGQGYISSGRFVALYDGAGNITHFACGPGNGLMVPVNAIPHF